MTKKIRLTRIQVIEYEPNPEFYKEGMTIEEMAQHDANFDDPELMFDNCLEDTIQYEIIDEVKDGEESPFLVTREVKTVTTVAYNPHYGDDRLCECGDPYDRHFDSYDNMYPVGCKYCSCSKFVEKK